MIFRVGLIWGLIVMGGGMTGRGIAAGSAARGAEYSGPETCAACHEEEHKAWKSSLHARAYSGRFQTSWNEHGKAPQCLACHTTGAKKNSLHFAFEGVTCESCHGAKSEEHPGGSKMPIPVSSEMCNACHLKTYQEWKVSRHGQKNVRCFDCHQVHAQGLRAGGGDRLCGSCHPGRLKDFAHATHHLEGLKCATCHMPGRPDRAGAIEGTGAAGHALSVGGEVCARCHEEMVHASHKIRTLTGQVQDLKPSALVKQVEDKETRIRQLELEVHLQKGRMIRMVILACVIGMAAGGVVAWRKR